MTMQDGFSQLLQTIKFSQVRVEEKFVQFQSEVYQGHMEGSENGTIWEAVYTHLFCGSLWLWYIKLLLNITQLRVNTRILYKL